MNKLVCTQYRLSIRSWPKMRIALVSDLHDRNGERALELLREEKPDLIAAVGDMLEARKPEKLPESEREIYALLDECGGDTGRGSRAEQSLKRGLNRFFARALGSFEGESGTNSNALDFLREAASIAPLCYSTGNHERYISAEETAAIKAAGAVYLDNSHAELCGLLVGGLTSRPDIKWLEAFGGLRGNKLLLCHHPEHWVRYAADKDIQLSLSGHAHGGQWRVGGRGLFAPGQGLLPRYTRGLYFGCRLVVGAGLSNPSRVPRINNPTELVIVNVNAEKRS